MKFDAARRASFVDRLLDIEDLTRRLLGQYI